MAVRTEQDLKTLLWKLAKNRLEDKKVGNQESFRRTTDDGLLKLEIDAGVFDDMRDATRMSGGRTEYVNRVTGTNRIIAGAFTVIFDRRNK